MHSYSSNALFYFLPEIHDDQKDFFQGFHPILPQNLQIFQNSIRKLLPQYCVLEDKLSAPKKKKGASHLYLV